MELFGISFVFYHFPLAAIAYPAALCMLLALLLVIGDFLRARRRHEHLQVLAAETFGLVERLPTARTQDEEDYQALIHILWQDQLALRSSMQKRDLDRADYYAMWIHQIKTPISAMHLRLQGEDSTLARKLSSELFRIEQYVAMLLSFERLDAASTDYVLKEQDMDTILREVIKKFSGEFIMRGLRLSYEPLDLCVTSDAKWLSFVLEQLLSNALKYTQKGVIQIFMESPATLCIQDSGIGIALEDLPRIFEKGYTGFNGREHQKSTGLGLYLCRRICHNLGHEISASCPPEGGTCIRLHLAQKAWQGD